MVNHQQNRAVLGGRAAVAVGGSLPSTALDGMDWNTMAGALYIGALLCMALGLQLFKWWQKHQKRKRQ